MALFTVLILLMISYGFTDFIKSGITQIALIDKKTSLYEYKNKYFLVLQDVNLSIKYVKNIINTINEFATYINNGDIFINFLIEKGKLIMKNNAIKNTVKFFS